MLTTQTTKMYFLQLSSNNNEIHMMADILSHLGCTKFAIFAYPEANQTHLLEIQKALVTYIIGMDILEPVTSYDGKITNVETLYYRYEAEVFNIINSLKCIIIKSIDSMAFYKSKESSWFACVIPHEDIMLFRVNDEELEEIKKSKIILDPAPPKNW